MDFLFFASGFCLSTGVCLGFYMFFYIFLTIKGKTETKYQGLKGEI